MRLLEKTTLGNIALKNRMVMAPMTRSRADSNGIIQPLATLYYQQRASAGLIISEAINISEQAIGLPFTPGLYTDAQIAAWKEVTAAVHEWGGKIFAQLWHTGRAGHSLNKRGAIPVSASAIAITGQQPFTAEGAQDFETPVALTTEEVKAVVNDYKQAAVNAMAAGFDGVELHAAFGYLPNQFLVASSNIRTDEYGGDIANRSRFTLEVMQAMISATGPHKVGIKLSPSNTYNNMFDSDPIGLYGYLLAQLNELPVAYIHLMQPIFPMDEFPHYPKDVLAAFGKLTDKAIIINGGYDRQQAEAELKNSRAQLVSFGGLFLANPDLPERFRQNTVLNEPDRATMYGGGGEEGYTDYPFLAQ